MDRHRSARPAPGTPRRPPTGTRTRAAAAAAAALACLAVSAVPAELAAQDRGFAGKAELQAYAGGFFPSQPDLGPGETEFDLGAGLLFGARVDYTLPFRLVLEGRLGFGSPSLETPSRSGNASVLLYGVGLGYSVPLGSDGVELLLATGAGATRWSVTALDPEVDLTLQFGTAVRIPLGETLALRIDARQHFLKDGFSATRRQLSPGLDPELSRSALAATELTAGLSLVLGGEGDADGDGVLDPADACPDTPAGVPVDSRGCPLDRDGDGVMDRDDRCPDTPRRAAVDERGCPTDSDGDGVPDGIDQCADTPAGIEVDDGGCPRDLDGDGVPEGRDRCPDTPFGVEVDASGCGVDTDADGVPDVEDICPDTPAGEVVEEDGCPAGEQPAAEGPPEEETPAGEPEEAPAGERELLDTGRLTLRNVYFDADAAVLRPESRPALDEAGRILVRNPELRFEVQGHTDAVGPAEYNRILSQRRAEAVVAYLLRTFPELEADRLVARGYGETRPIASNQTAEGRQQNRRVEIVLPEEGETP